MKSLAIHVQESLFETKWAPGEIVQFIPQSRHMQEFGLQLAALTGTVEEVKIGRLQQFYTIHSNGLTFDGVPESDISQDINVLLTRISDINNGVQRI
jgi:hypothetical protein